MGIVHIQYPWPSSYIGCLAIQDTSSGHFIRTRDFIQDFLGGGGNPLVHQEARKCEGVGGTPSTDFLTNKIFGDRIPPHPV